MKTKELDQEALEHTIMQVQGQLPYLPVAYIVSTIRNWLDTGLGAVTDTGREVLRVYQQCLDSRD